MRYRRLGNSGLQVSELSFGTWLDFEDQTLAKAMIREAFDQGVNFFDTAEVYAKGKSEEALGFAIKEFNRSELVISTKIFWGGEKPNQTGLSFKHLVEGTKASLKRLQLETVDCLFCHRPDENTPLEETLFALNHLIHQGLIFYYGTSMWSREELERAFLLCEQKGWIPPQMEQPVYNLFEREKVEKELAPLVKEKGLGLTVFSPLARGVLTGKYQNEIPKNSRFTKVPGLKKYLDPKHQKLVELLKKLAIERGMELRELAISYCLANQDVSTVIVGASSVEQLKQNLKEPKSLDKEALLSIKQYLGESP